MIVATPPYQPPIVTNMSDENDLRSFLESEYLSEIEKISNSTNKFSNLGISLQKLKKFNLRLYHKVNGNCKTFFDICCKIVSQISADINSELEVKFQHECLRDQISLREGFKNSFPIFKDIKTFVGPESLPCQGCRRAGPHSCWK